MRTTTFILLLVLVTVCGCVERKLTVTSTPPGARVYLDDQEKGLTPVTFKFNFYGHRTFTLKKEGYRIRQEVRKVKTPVYDWPGLDVFADLGPIPVKDHKSFHFKLEPITPVKTDELLERARQMKARTTGEPVPERPAEPPAQTESTAKPDETTPEGEREPAPAEPEAPSEK